ncbi:hypothetical protein OK016_27330 [Vibrio chagasii]|nr:hypothetical protein [Vibrio chagasii]
MDLAKEAGSEFIVAPSYRQTRLSAAKRSVLPIVPGVNNPSQVEQ